MSGNLRFVVLSVLAAAWVLVFTLVMATQAMRYDMPGDLFTVVAVYLAAFWCAAVCTWLTSLVLKGERP